MNQDWINFLKSHHATITDDSVISFPKNQAIAEHSITPVTHLNVIKITGTDAAQFLQGQLTCNINEITESSSFFTAFCNAKGRTICTLLIYKRDNAFYIVLPEELTDKVITKLKMYVLRSAVQIENVSNDLCLIGLTTNKPNLLTSLPNNLFDNTQGTIKLPSQSHRYLIINTLVNSINLWNQLSEEHNAESVDSNTWLFQDISAGIPWLTKTTSEEYIPQMLNIDKLGGISFNKGCYTGQEVIARTHYLGKTKRELFLAECHLTAMLEDNIKVFTKSSEQSVGQILSSQSNDQITRILTVMQNSDKEFKNLVLNNPNQDKVNIIDFQ